LTTEAYIRTGIGSSRLTAPNRALTRSYFPFAAPTKGSRKIRNARHIVDAPFPPVRVGK
jgi:hypothetical protein